jgi:hypothetical protein
VNNDLETRLKAVVVELFQNFMMGTEKNHAEPQDG